MMKTMIRTAHGFNYLLVSHFHQLLHPHSAQRASSLRNEFFTGERKLFNYFGSPLTDDWLFDTELISKIFA